MEIVQRNPGRMAGAALIMEIIRQSASELTREQQERLASMAGQLVRQGAQGLATLPNAFSQLARQVPELARGIQDAGRNIINAARDGRLSDDGMRSGNRGIVRQSETSLTNLRSEAEMDVVEEPVAEAAAARLTNGSGGPGGSVSKETPISSYPSLTYGLQETHTTILPWTGWFSVPCTTSGIPANLRVRMNSPYDFFLGAVTQVTTDITPGSGMFNKPITADGTIKSAIQFPEAINNEFTTERPYWRNYWAQLYEYYTVLGCEWKLTIANPVNIAGSEAMVGWTYDSYSDTSGASGQLTPATNLSESMSFKNMNFVVVNERTSAMARNSIEIIEGRYKPGMIKRNIVNDGDVKTWTQTSFDTASPVDGSIPNLKELLSVMFWRSPMNHGTNAGVNVQIELKWIVQYKDLRDLARYPRTTPAGTSIVQTISSNKADYGNPIGKWN